MCFQPQQIQFQQHSNGLSVGLFGTISDGSSGRVVGQVGKFGGIVDERGIYVGTLNSFSGTIGRTEADRLLRRYPWE